MDNNKICELTLVLGRNIRSLFSIKHAALDKIGSSTDDKVSAVLHIR